MSEAVEISTISCPECGGRSREEMPTDACLYFWECPNCGTMIKPKEGDCCVFCSYGSRPCPPARGEGNACC